MNREDAQRAHDMESEFFGGVNKATIDIGNLTLRTSVLINGGATIAVLGFIGAVISRDKFDVAHINAVAQSMIWFCYGIVSAVVGMAFAYLTNYFMVTISNSKLRTWQHPFIAPGPKTKFYTITNIVFH